MFVITLHRTIGLVLGAWLTLVGLSGTFLVYHEELDTWLAADMMTAAEAPTSFDFDRMLGVVRTAYPDRAVLFFQRYGHNTHESAPFGLSAPHVDPSTINDVEAEADLEVFVDPVTFQIMGARPYQTWMRAIRSFHRELLVPGVGQRVLGVIGIVVLTTVIAGMVLWWRENNTRLARGLRLRLSSPRPRLLRDLHTVLGIYIAVFLALQTASGIIICDWLQIRVFFTRLLGAVSPPPEIALTQTLTATVSANAARDKALSVHLASEVVMIKFPLRSEGRYSVRLYPTDQPIARHMRQIEVSAATGEIVARYDPDLVSGPQAIMNLWMIWIHNGHFFGAPGRVIVLMTGLVLTTLFPTGFYIWNRKRKSRRHKNKSAA